MDTAAQCGWDFDQVILHHEALEEESRDILYDKLDSLIERAVEWSIQMKIRCAIQALLKPLESLRSKLVRLGRSHDGWRVLVNGHEGFVQHLLRAMKEGRLVAASISEAHMLHARVLVRQIQCYVRNTESSRISAHFMDDKLRTKVEDTIRRALVLSRKTDVHHKKIKRFVSEFQEDLASRCKSEPSPLSEAEIHTVLYGGDAGVYGKENESCPTLLSMFLSALQNHHDQTLEYDQTLEATTQSLLDRVDQIDQAFDFLEVKASFLQATANEFFSGSSGEPFKGLEEELRLMARQTDQCAWQYHAMVRDLAICMIREEVLEKANDAEAERRKRELEEEAIRMQADLLQSEEEAKLSKRREEEKKAKKRAKEKERKEKERLEKEIVLEEAVAKKKQEERAKTLAAEQGRKDCERKEAETKRKQDEEERKERERQALQQREKTKQQREQEQGAALATEEQVQEGRKMAVAGSRRHQPVGEKASARVRGNGGEGLQEQQKAPQIKTHKKTWRKEHDGGGAGDAAVSSPGGVNVQVAEAGSGEAAAAAAAATAAATAAEMTFLSRFSVVAPSSDAPVPANSGPGPAGSAMHAAGAGDPPPPSEAHASANALAASPQAPAAPAVCQECDENADWTSFCTDCDLALCEDCTKHHRKSKRSKHHALLTVAEFRERQRLLGILGAKEARNLTNAPAPEAGADAPAALAEGRECVVCLEEERSHVLVPCGHACVCEVCARSVVASTKECPVCRSHCEKIIKVFL